MAGCETAEKGLLNVNSNSPIEQSIEREPTVS